MSIEDRIRDAVLDQDHLADLLSGNEESAEQIRYRVIELLHQGLAELYTHAKGSQVVEVLSREAAVEIATNAKNWSWRSEIGEEQLYFLGPVRLEGGALAYGA